ncbi:MAG: hypothetical protein GYB26_00365 [Gammaproteobacteria bacterium]|uniref:Uncharacterized protein n=1 Tax=Marinobacter litoralis TaxID=187981 RepID=A0A3M2R9M9_9GAMM|nr:hypothetical protein [Marinobacter litoralis]MBR9869577.1 hypothetical protein [Gammaproteobacteria bacterium]RMJ01982.1 hypothetical protein DOQ08_02771 [Marinobacter litoralis]
MTGIRTRFTSVISAFLFLTLATFGARAQETGGEFLADLHDFRINNYFAVDAFYSFSATGDTETLNRIVVAINKANDAMNSVIASTSGVLSADQIEGLNQSFDKYKDLMRSNINEVRDRGYPDLRLMADLADTASTMNATATELYSVAQQNSGAKADDRVESARSASVLMAQMMARYAARTHSSVSQTFQGATTEIPLDEQAEAFDQYLKNVNSGSPTGELKEILSDVSSKWQFIRSSYVNYNDNNVSFIIDRYSKGIIAGLTSAIELMNSSS